MADAFRQEVPKELRLVRVEIGSMRHYLEDTRLTAKEKALVDSRIQKIKSGDTSDFISWKDAKKKLS